MPGATSVRAAAAIIAQVEERFWSRLAPAERDDLSAICGKLLAPEPPTR